MDENFNIVIIDEDENTGKIIKSYLSSNEKVNICGVFTDFETGLEALSKIGKCVLFIDVSRNFDRAVVQIKNIKDNYKDVFVAALSDKTSTENIIKVMRAGAKEFITKPVIQTKFLEIIEEIKAEYFLTEQIDTCKIISTFSNKGGIGKTSIAVNLAVELAQMTKEKVALIDLNLQLGDVATFLDLSPAFAIDYISDNINNLNDEDLLKAMTRYKNTSLYVIADPLNVDKSQDITAEQIKKILSALKKNFSYIVIDIASNIDSKTIMALDYSDLILLISTANLPAIRSTQRCMEFFKKLNYGSEKTKLVLNRYMDNEEIKTPDIEEVFKQKVYWKIPNNYLTMMSAINKGVPVNEINSEANISVNYKTFAAKVSDYLITERLSKNFYNKQ